MDGLKISSDKPDQTRPPHRIAVIGRYSTMTLQLTGTSSRITKSPSKANAKRKSPLKPLRRNRALFQPFISPAKQQEQQEHQETFKQQELQEPPSRFLDDAKSYSDTRPSLADHALPDCGASQYLSSCDNVIEAIHRIRRDMFAELPAQRLGMNSTRTADLLNYRRGLPPIVPLSHIHVLVNDSTMVEREVAKLTAEGKLRRIYVPMRGKSAALGDCLILMDDWEGLLQKSALDWDVKSMLFPRYLPFRFSSCLHRRAWCDSLVYMLTVKLGADKFFSFLRSNPKPQAASTENFSQAEIRQLVNAGFLVTNTFSAMSTDTRPSRFEQGPDSSSGGFRATTMSLSIPNIGAYLYLLTSARAHLLHLLAKSTYNEAPLSLLREHWDGNVEDESSYAAQARRARGEWAGILPGRTKKWRDFKGLNFLWVLEQAVGDGVIEIFETGTVGPGVRRV